MQRPNFITLVGGGYTVLIINVCLLCLAAIVQVEHNSIVDEEHLHIFRGDRTAMLIPVIIAFLARSKWFSFLLLIAFSYFLLRYSYEIWMIRNEIPIRYPVNVYFFSGILFYGSLLYGIVFAVIAAALRILAWSQSTRRSGGQ